MTDGADRYEDRTAATRGAPITKMLAVGNDIARTRLRRQPRSTGIATGGDMAIHQGHVLLVTGFEVAAPHHVRDDQTRSRSTERDRIALLPAIVATFDLPDIAGGDAAYENRRAVGRPAEQHRVTGRTGGGDSAEKVRLLYQFVPPQ